MTDEATGGQDAAISAVRVRRTVTMEIEHHQSLSAAELKHGVKEAIETLPSLAAAGVSEEAGKVTVIEISAVRS